MARVWQLERAFQVDLVINYLNRKIVIIRFGNEAEEDCKQTDRWIQDSINDETMKRNAVIFKVHTKDVPELVARYNLSGPSALVFFYDNTVLDRLYGDNLKQERQARRLVEVMKSRCDSKGIALRGSHRT